MPRGQKKNRIPEHELAEYWFSFMHQLLGEMQSTYRNANEKRGLTQEGIAERLDRDPGFISRCLHGRQNMTVRTINNIARAMDCRLNVSFQSLAELQPSNRRPELAWKFEPAPPAVTDFQSEPIARVQNQEKALAVTGTA